MPKILVTRLSGNPRPTLLDALHKHQLETQYTKGLSDVPDALTSFDPDLLLCEIIGDSDDDFEFVETWHKQKPALPVIVVAQVANQASLKAAFARGAFDYLVNPLESQDIISCVDSALERVRIGVDSARYIHFLEEQLELRSLRAASLHERHDRLGNNLPGTLLAFDTHFNWTYAARSVEDLLGYTPTEAMHITVRELFTTESYDSLMEHLPREFVSGQCLPCNRNCEELLASLIHKDGHEVQVYMRVTLNEGIQDDLLEIFLWLEQLCTEIPEHGHPRPIQRQEQARDALASHNSETEQAMRKLARIINRSSTVAFCWSTSQEWPVTYVSENVREFGYAPEDFTSGKLTYQEFVHPEDEPRARQEVTEYLTEGVDHFQQRYRVVTRDGEERWVLDRTWTLKDENGDIIGMEGLIEDISQSLLIQQKLQDREEKYRLITRNINDIIWTMSLDMRFTFVSPSVKRILGYDVWKLYNITLSEIIAEKSLQTVMLVLEKQLALEHHKGSDPNRSETLELEHLTARGDSRWLEVRMNFLRDDKGEVSGIVGVSRDITERRQAQKARDNLERQLRQSQKLEAVGLLAGGIAHDFNNLLTGIVGNIALIEMDTKPSDPMRDLLADVRLASERAAKLTRQLLAFSRRQVIEPHPLDLNRLVRDLSTMLERVLGETILLKTQFFQDLGVVRADIGQMEQMLLNLAVNARDAMPKGGKITIQTENIHLVETFRTASAELKPGRYVRLSVLDTGLGMDETTINRIFEPFFTTKPKEKGTGLGLSTVFGIVSQHNGAIQVESTPGEGSAFHIYLPCVDESVKSTILNPTSPMPGGDECILVVEDDPVVRKLAIRTLNRLGYTVFEASNGSDALVLLSEQKPKLDLLVTDLVMPRMNGVELAIRINAEMENLPILFTSGYSDGLLEKREVNQLKHAFIAKPFSPHELALKIRELLGESTQ